MPDVLTGMLTRSSMRRSGQGPGSTTRPSATRTGRPEPARLDASIRTISGLCLWAALLLLTGRWVADGGIQDFLTSWADGLTALGRLSGLVAAQLLLVQVLLMARIPLLELAFGRQRLVRIHRRVGLLSFWLMLTHIGTIVLGYASARWSLVPSTLWQLLTGYAGILLAVAGTLCLLMVVVTSIRATRRRLRYESWHLLHLYGYLGAGLALPHQLWTGEEFNQSPVMTGYWWAIWICAASAVVTWRLLLPLGRTLRHRLRVSEVTQEAPNVVSVRMTGRRLDRLPVQAGQFVVLRFLTLPGWTRANPFSLSAAPDGRTLRITAKIVGDGTARLTRLRPGTSVLFEGPYGRLSHRARSRSKVLLAGAGLGIAPLRSLAEGLSYAPGDALLLHRYTDRRLFSEELEQLQVRRGLQVIDLPGRRAHPKSALGPSVDPAHELVILEHIVPDVADRDVYLCGPEAWTQLMVVLTRRAGVPDEQIHIEAFAW